MTVGIRHDDLRRRNRAMVLAAIRRAGCPSRTEISRTTELSHSTISAIAADLIGEALLTEVRAPETGLSRRGRPQVALGLNSAAACVATLVLSLNRIEVALVDYSGTPIVQETRRLQTLALGREKLIEAVVGALRGVIERHRESAGPLRRITLAVQGITDARARALAWSPITPHTDIPFGRLLEDTFSVPVTAHNDCNMMAVGLQRRHPERYRDNFVAILLSHGIGMGLMLKGALFTGPHSSAGEFGHMVHHPHGALCRCGRMGCIEAYAGNYAIWRNANGDDDRSAPEADIPVETMQALADAARREDGRARKAYEAAGEAIGFGLGSLFALIDPAPVAIAGQGACAFDLLEPTIRKAIAGTAGGRHSSAITFDPAGDERPLIREGSALTALASLDEELSIPGGPLADKSRAIA